MKLASAFTFLFISIFVNISYAGISLGSTRVVISDGKNEGSINVHNKNDSNYLIQSWVLDESEKSTEDFVLTPPLFKLNSNTSNSLRVLLVKDLPQDKESLYWLNVKFIPSTNKNDDANKLTFAINNQVKIIYRPKSLSGNEMVEEFKKITIKKSGDNLKFTNPTKYYISISEILVDKKSLMAPSYISPESDVLVSLKGNNSVSKVEYTFVDDLGKLNLFEMNF
ncbi:molecular chaperone [Morganella psychrotolerans]|uniref:Molecular chaperone n=1 Tax=Morganella psychrotolerans TaxID=368603 RepID=A0A5M9RB46_9GAMM|nr:molecular chaperone [Morganella psychrotolerans]KAA8716655.1 molecular chaperone [Morganella psychrotolerans]